MYNKGGFLTFKNYLPELRHYSLTIVLLFLTIDSLEILLEVENQNIERQSVVPDRSEAGSSNKGKRALCCRLGGGA